ncbi:hypothetical protein V8E53_000792 [Lactarius tabidus]
MVSRTRPPTNDGTPIRTCVRTHIRFDLPATVDTLTPGTTTAPSHLPAMLNSSPPPILLPGADAEASTAGLERRVREGINYAEPKFNLHVKQAALGGSQAPSDDDIPMFTEQRHKSRPRLLADDDKESDGVQAIEVPLAGLRVCTAGLANVVSRWGSASRERLVAIFDRRRRGLTKQLARVIVLLLSYAPFFSFLCSSLFIQSRCYANE